MKLRTFGMTVVAALSLVAGRADAQDAGWDTKYGVLFTIPNLFQNNSSQLMDGYNGLVGVQYNLGPQAALRLSADLYRFSEGVTKSTDAAGNETETVPGITSEFAVTLIGEYLMRMSQSAVSPYVGAGAFIGFDQSSQKGEAKYNGTVFAEFDSTSRGYGLGVIGKLGLEWRIHKVVALFAEYQASLTLVEGESEKDDIDETESSEKHFLNLSTGIGQGGRLGLVAFF